MCKYCRWPIRTESHSWVSGWQRFLKWSWASFFAFLACELQRSEVSDTGAMLLTSVQRAHFLLTLACTTGSPWQQQSVPLFCACSLFNHGKATEETRSLQCRSSHNDTMSRDRSAWHGSVTPELFLMELLWLCLISTPSQMLQQRFGENSRLQSDVNTPAKAGVLSLGSVLH